MNVKLKEKYFLVIVIITFINMFISGGLANNLPIYTLPISESLNMARSSFSLCSSIRSVISVISGAMSGFLFSKFGGRVLIPASLIVGAIGYFIFSQAHDITTLCLGYAVLGIGDGICIINTSVYVVGRWFHKNHGIVLGLVSAATGIGGGVFGILLSNIIEESGWRTSFFVSAFCYIALAVLVVVFMRDKPQDIGISPYGEGVSKGKDDTPVFEGYTEKQLFKKPVYYFFLLLTFLSCLSAYMVSSIVVPFFQDKGFSITQAASVNSVFLVALAISKLILGFLNDKIGAKAVTFLSVLSGTVATLLLARVTGLFAGYLTMVPLSLFLTMAAVVPPLVCTELFGHRAGPKPATFVVSAASTANLCANLASNTVYDFVGTYVPVIYGVSIASIAIICLWAVLFFFAEKEKRKFLKQ